MDNTTDNYFERLDKEIHKNIKQIASGFSISKKRFVDNSQFMYDSLYNQHIYPAEIEGRIPSRLRKARKPYWRHYTPYGITKNIDTNELRQLGNTVWVKRCKDIIISEVLSAAWEIVATDKDDYSTETRTKIQMVKTFFKAVNREGENIKNVLEPVLNDMLDLGMGTITKGFVKNAYQNIIIDEDKLPHESVHTHSTLNYVPNKAGEGMLRELTAQDSAEFFLQPDEYGTGVGWWQWGYSQGIPVFFGRREIADIHYQKTTYNPYGLSPVETIKNIVNVLTTSVANMRQYMDDGAIPPGIIVLQKTTEEEFRIFKTRWDSEIKGSPGDIPTVGAGEQGQLEYVPLVINTADIKQLDTIDVYAKVVMSAFHVTSDELGYTQDSNKASAEQQARVQQRAAIFPLHDKTAQMLNRYIINEFDTQNKIKFQWVKPMTIEEETAEFNLVEKKLNAGLLTINQYHTMKGESQVPWGNNPFNIHTWLSTASQQDPSLLGFKEPSVDPETAKIDFTQRQMLLILEQMIHMMNDDRDINPGTIEALARLKILQETSPSVGLILPPQSVIESENAIDILSQNQTFQNTADVFNLFGRDSIAEMEQRRKKKDLNSNDQKNIRDIFHFSDKTKQFLLARAFLIDKAQDKAMQKKIDRKTDVIGDVMFSSFRSILKRWYYRILGHVDGMAQQGHIPEATEIDKELAKAVMFEGFTDMVRDSFKEAYKLGFSTNNRGQTRQEIVKNDATVDAFPTIREVIDDRATMFSDTYLNKYAIDIRREINDGLAKGRNMYQIGGDLRGIVPFEPKRGETEEEFKKREKSLDVKLKRYARTEIVGAMNIGRLNQLKALGVTHWEYRAYFDELNENEKPFLLRGEKVTCRGLHGKVFSIEDTRFLPTVHINCRCGIRGVFNQGKSFDDEFDELFDDFKEVME